VVQADLCCWALVQQLGSLPLSIHVVGGCKTWVVLPDS
jgi:hypothetical protein